MYVNERRLPLTMKEEKKNEYEADGCQITIVFYELILIALIISLNAFSYICF